jgi:hypothetical protein
MQNPGRQIYERANNRVESILEYERYQEQPRLYAVVAECGTLLTAYSSPADYSTQGLSFVPAS